MFKRKHKKAFTIVELVIVIAVIAILMGIMFIGGTAINNNAKKSALDSDLRNYELALKSMVNDPSNVSLLQTPVTAATVKDALNVYFEDDMAIGDFAASDDAAKATVASYEAVTKMKDPYGMFYRVVLMDDSDTDNTDISLIVYSYGKNKQTSDTGATSKWDADDVVRVVRVVDSVIYTYDLGAGSDCKWETADATYQAWSNRAFTKPASYVGTLNIAD